MRGIASWGIPIARRQPCTYKHHPRASADNARFIRISIWEKRLGHDNAVVQSCLVIRLLSIDVGRSASFSKAQFSLKSHILLCGIVVVVDIAHVDFIILDFAEDLYVKIVNHGSFMPTQADTLVGHHPHLRGLLSKRRIPYRYFDEP